MAAKNILIIDPDAATRAFLSSQLRQNHYSVLQVATAKEGLIVSWRDHPDLIIIDPLIHDLPVLEFAAKVRQDRRTSHIPLVALTAEDSSPLRQACLTAGFNDWIVKSPDAPAVILESLARLLPGHAEAEEPLPQPPADSRNGLSIFFISAKGGIGTSSLCANLAMNMAENEPEARIAVVDMVLPIGSIASIVGYQGSGNIVSFSMQDPEEWAQEISPDVPAGTGKWIFHVVPGAKDPDNASKLRVDKIGSLLEYLKNNFDYVIVDSGRSLSKFTLPLLQRADLLVMIVSTDLSSVTLSKTLLDYLRSRNIKDQSLFTILNRAVGLEGLSRADAEQGLGVEIKTTFPYLVHFTLANNQHHPFTLKYPTDTTAVIAFHEVAERIAEAAHRSREARSAR